MKLLLPLLFAAISFIGNSQIDTLLYPEAKATAYLGVTMNVPSEFAGYSQYYDAPEQIVIKGLKFYAGVNSTNPNDTAIVTCYLFDAGADSSVQAVRRQKDITIPSGTFNPSNPGAMERVLLFDTPDTVTGSFHLGMMTQTNFSLGVLTNDYNAGDGQNEELGYWYWTGDNTWYKSGEFFAWDVDYLILPIIEYLPNSSLTDTSCADYCINYTPSPASQHRMYNQYVFSGGSTTDSTIIDWGDGSQSLIANNCNSYSAHGNFNIQIEEKLGWTNPLLSRVTNLDLTIFDFDSTISITSCGDYNSPQGNTYSASGTYIDTIQGVLGCDSLITIILDIPETDTAINVTECFDYLSPAGNLYTSDGIYYDTLASVNACDSIIEINLTLNTVDNSTSVAGFTITANSTSAQYQWIDCDNGFAPIAGETNQSFTALANGSYAVILTDNNCTDTSSCVQIQGVSLSEYGAYNLKVYPNPSNGIFNFTFDDSSETLRIVDVNGKLVMENSMLLGNSISLDLRELDKGVYFALMQFRDGNSSSVRLIKQ